MKTLTNIFLRETGQTMTEYAVTLGVITIGIVLALTSLASVTVNTILRVAGFFS